MLRRSPALLVACLSLLLSAMMSVLWVRSYLVHDALDWGTSKGRAGLLSADGRLVVGRTTIPPTALAYVPRGLQYRAESRSTELKPSWSSWSGVQVTHVAQGGFVASDVRIPYWFLLPLTSIPFALWLYRRLWPPVPPSCCPACGYDLRASPDRCPECGRASDVSPSQ